MKLVDESVQEISLKLARCEELLKYRYTEKDKGYRQTMQRPPRYVVSPDWTNFGCQKWSPRTTFGRQKWSHLSIQYARI